MKNEKNYDFRKRWCKVHKRIAGFADRVCDANEIKLTSPVKIWSDCETPTAKHALLDFRAYFKSAFGYDAVLTEDKDDAAVRVFVDADRISGYMARSIEVADDGVVIIASDDRGAAQALYSLEDRMNKACAPFLEKGSVEQRPLFAPRMIHSGYGMDVFPDEYLSVCAHYGYDTVLSYVRNAYDYEELADLVKRAAKFGIDVYAYSAFSNFVHPEDEGAKEIYAEKYGGIFKAAPGLKGIVFVGESVEFPSRDPHVDCRPYTVAPKGGIPTGKPTPGWWPCYDYAEWVTLIRDSIRAVSPNADIVFWTYNWGCTPKADRLALIERLPTDISLQVTFEMFNIFDIGSSKSHIADYTISFPGPGDYFLSEAEAAKARGIRLYTMANTAGRTWDFGVVPYEPFPERWNDRNQKLLECREKYGLCGLMESHHFGFTPSFISRLAGGTFTEGSADFEERLKSEARLLSDNDYELVLDALHDLDESQKYYVASNENQYGPYRIGPAFPFCLNRMLKKPNTPEMTYGNSIYKTLPVQSDAPGRWPYSLRVRDELNRHKKALALTKSALAKLKRVKNKNAELKRFVNMVEFMLRCHITAVNFKEFYIVRTKLLAAATRDEVLKYVSKIEKIAYREIENAKAAIPLVKRDSALGYEPSMDYQCDEESINWKLRQMEYMLRVELSAYRI